MSVKSSDFLMCFFLGPPAEVVVLVPGPGFPLPPGARGSSLCLPNASLKNLADQSTGGSGDFPFVWDSSIPLGILMSIGVNIL